LEAKKVLFCDRVPENVTFIPTGKPGDPAQAATGTPQSGIPGSDRGIIVKYNGKDQTLTNAKDGDIGQYFPAGTDPAIAYPGIDCGGSNTNGAVVVDLGLLPNATGQGTPTASYGLVRFRGRVK
jgi:hypothetical protein